ncbi:Holliday junction resolvase-like protein [Treponema sp.]|uniref:Holliday junction resolvase-like protein n=1 Tax=Treponema sp. TaxID=166 RepID=UPI003F10A4E4
MENSTVQNLFSGISSSAFFIALALFAGFVFGCFVQKLKSAAEIKRQRRDAVNRSRAVLGGQFSEQLAPFLPGFPCNPGDARFIGKPVDFVAFPGSAEGGSINEIYFIEVKTAQSKLSARERQIKEAVEHGRVKYFEYRIP